MRRRTTVLVVIPAGLVLIILLGTCYMTHMPGDSIKGPVSALDGEGSRSRQRIERHVHMLAHQIGPRHLNRHGALERAAEYIEENWRQQGYEVQRQPFRVQGREVHNLAVQIRGGKRAEQVVVIGAHYDTVPGTPGANDNASGIAALLEISRELAGIRGKRTLRFVAFVNEEPPYFKTNQMGSLVYARRCKKAADRVVAMLSLETIGYYTDAPGSQQYPFPFNLLYPDTGNFIAVVGNVSSRTLVRRVVRLLREHARLPSEGAAVPGFIPGVGWSDHWSFWRAGYPAAMVTDTAPYRYPHYHMPQDTPDKLDFVRLTKVVAGLVRVVDNLVSQQ